MAALRIIAGVLLGFGLAFAYAYVGLHLIIQVGASTSLIVALVAGVIGAVYSAFAFAYGVYCVGVFSIAGYLLDMTWSLLNTTASLLVWLPACLIGGGAFVEPDDLSRRSGTFVYHDNPRGGGYDATTVGTVIAGGWSSHEETHVWQARLFGPFYLPVYLICLVLNVIFRLCTGNTDNLVEQAYFRVCFEDWAYAAGSSHSDELHPGMWLLWFLLSLLYLALCALVGFGVATGSLVLSLVAAVALASYHLIRSFTPTNQ